MWFKRTGQWENYQGIVNNGYHTNGSWEIRMGNENNGTLVGGMIMTNVPGEWDYGYLQPIYASQSQWHHVVMTYDSFNLSYYSFSEKDIGVTPR